LAELVRSVGYVTSIKGVGSSEIVYTSIDGAHDFINIDRSIEMQLRDHRRTLPCNSRPPLRLESVKRSQKAEKSQESQKIVSLQAS
jgi:hypothetical protein